MSWKENVKNWDGKLYKVLNGNKSCHGGDFEWSLPKDGNPGDWTPIIENVKMCEKGYHLTTHYAHWSDKKDIFIYEAEGDVVDFDGFDKVVCSRARLLKLVENPFNDNNSGDNNSGYKNSGDCNSGNKNSGNYNSGNKNSGNNNSGNHNTGNYNFGNWNSGNFNYFGYRNSGDYNFGNFNSGSWNYGDRNFGYFCNNFLPIMLFDKPIPNDSELKFPDWIYFELVPEGYHTSWQKAFEKADVEGIEELLALPNFDYEIFEDITSITKKQIEDKINGILYKKLKISRNCDSKLYKVLRSNQSCHGGNFEWSLPEGNKPGDWTPTIENVKMCKRGYHLTTHYAHWSDEKDVSIYEAEGDVIEFDGYDKAVCSRARLLRLVEDPFNKDNSRYNNLGNYNSGIWNSGNYNSGIWNSGNYNSGIWNSGNYNSGNCNSGDKNFGNSNSGDYNYNGWNSGDFNFGSHNSGSFNSGNYNTGDWNSGNYNTGDWNSGNWNFGYFCRNSSPVMLFNKPILKDSKFKFPEWIYFELVPEEYHESWQKAFEKADVKGIEELLVLPNFDYEIFEEITSITKKQINEKLGE